MRRVGAVIILLVVGVLSGCVGTNDGTNGGGQPGETTGTPLPDVEGTITVFAAASLTEAFDALATRFEQLHPSAEVVLNYGGSSALAGQIGQGAPADVFASADERTMETVVDAGDVATPVIFTSNTLEIAVPSGNPAGVDDLADLTDPDLAIALCDPQVPCGATAQAIFEAAGLTAAADTLEPDVKAVLTKVELGEVDAGIVYVTDVLAAGDAVDGIPIPEALSVINLYPIGVVTLSPNKVGAQAWIDFVLSDDGQSTLAAAGFVAR